MDQKEIERRIKYYQRSHKKLQWQMAERDRLREYLELDRDPDWVLKKADR